jgi:lipopolysaccharide transport system ATP-binding protein
LRTLHSSLILQAANHHSNSTMNQPAITVTNLGKSYRLGKFNKSDTFRDVLISVVKAPINRLKNLGEHKVETDNTFWALDDVSFNVSKGDVVGIIGRNGAGKSTLLKMLSRITEPTKGEIELRGRVSSLLEVGTGFHPELTGRENIFLNGSILGMRRSEIKAKFDEIVAFSEIEKFLDTPVKRYSSGMYVRLAFAVAAHLEPEILIVDEVLAVGDAMFQQKCLGKMKEISQGGERSVLFVSHNIQAVQNLCNKVVLIEKGKMKFYGDVNQGVDLYLNSLSSDKSYNLYERKSDDSPKAYISKCKVLSSEGEFSALGYPIGEQLVFDIEVVFNQTVYSPMFGIGINNSTNTRIVTLHTDYSSVIETTYPKGKYRFKCVMKDLYLKPGTYYIKLHLNVTGGEDEIDPALLLKIVEKDNNKYKRIHNGIVLTNQEWLIEEIDK